MSFSNNDDDEDFIIDDGLSSDYYDEFRTNSSSSIKWSIDARKQNEEDWLSIEEILYGEKELPDDEKTREEFVCWMEAFPHLRVVGKKIENLPPRNNSSVEYLEEIIAIDPPAPLRFENESFKLLDQELNEKLSIRKARQLSAKGHATNPKVENLEKLLRITSSGLTRQQQNGNVKPMTNSGRRTIDRTATYEITNTNNIVPSNYQNIKKLSQIKERDYSDTEKLSSYSASSRMGNLLNVKFLYKKPEYLDTIQSVKSATSKLPLYELVSLDKSNNLSKSASIHKKNLNIIQLPPFNYDLDFPVIQGRGIQSAIGKNASTRTYKH